MKKYAILGFGLEGQESFKYLSKKIKSDDIFIAEQNEGILKNDSIKNLLKKLPKENLFLGENYLDVLDCVDIVVKSPGISILKNKKLLNAIKSKKVKLSSNMDLFFDNKKGRVIAISGSKGKSTTTSLIYAIFKHAKLNPTLLGNIGIPATSALKKDNKNSLYVIEMSSYQLENFNHKLDAAVFTSFFPEHLDYHLTLKNYKNAKLNLPKNVKTNGILVYNKILEKIYPKYNLLKCKKERGVTNKDFVKDNFIYINNEKYIDTNKIKLIGKHNFENAILAIKIAKKFNIKDDVIKNAIKKFTPLSHRLENAGKVNGITFIDDAISTTPESTIAGIDSINLPISSIVLGGLDRGYKFNSLIKKVMNKKIKRIAFLKDSGIRIKKELEAYCKKNKLKAPTSKIFNSMDGVVSFCVKDAPQNTVCLLSCASPSYSIFKNYIEKGNLFKKEIEKLRK